MRIFFFCGHKSPYGISYLKPLLHSIFDIGAVVIATDKRWDIFSEKLLGKIYYPYRDSGIERLKCRIKKVIKKLIPSDIIRKFKTAYEKPVNVEKLLKNYKIPLYYIDDINSKEFIQKIRDAKIDLILCAAYPQIFSKELISISSRCSVNFHPSLLPKFRGAHPHYWAIVKGEEESGLTAHFMTENIDEGDIIAQIRFPISNYNYKQLYEKIITETPNLIKKVEVFFLEGTGEAVKQNSSEISYFSNDREIHHRIFWNIHSDRDIFNLVRAGNAFCFFRNSKIVIEGCSVTSTNRNLTNDIKVENGTLVDLHQDGIAIKTKSGIVNITKLRYRNKKMGFLEFIIKYKPLIGEKFE